MIAEQVYQEYFGNQTARVQAAGFSWRSIKFLIDSPV